MTKIKDYIIATMIDFIIAILIFVGGSFLALGTFDTDKYPEFMLAIVLVMCICIIGYLLFTNMKRRSIGFLLCGYKYTCEKGLWRVVLSNFIFYTLRIMYFYTYSEKHIVLFYVFAGLLFIDYIGFFVSGVNNRFLCKFLGISFEKIVKIRSKKEEICI